MDKTISLTIRFKMDENRDAGNFCSEVISRIENLMEDYGDDNGTVAIESIE